MCYQLMNDWSLGTTFVLVAHCCENGAILDLIQNPIESESGHAAFLQEFIILQPTIFVCRLFNHSRFICISWKLGQQIVGKLIGSSFAIRLWTKELTFSFAMSD